MSSAVKRFARDVVIVVALVGVGAGVFAWFALRPRGPQNHRPLGGPNVDVSNAGLAQFEVSAAIDPRNPRILLAGSNDEHVGSRVYESSDGGRTWRSRPGPPLPDATPCGIGDPAVAIGPDGRQYYALLVDTLCNDEVLHLNVATRSGPRSPWRGGRVEPRPRVRYKLDDKPAIVVDREPESRHRGRVYVAWTKWYTKTLRAVAVSHSDDGGRSWSPPVTLDRGRTTPVFTGLAVDSHGGVYLSYVDNYRRGVFVTRSADGGTTFAPSRRIARYGIDVYRECVGEETANIDAIPAQPTRCVSAEPQIAIGRDDRAYVAFSKLEANRTEGVFVVGVDRRLRPGRIARGGPPDSMPADQFWPALTADRSRGHLWLCYYDTTGDRSRRSTWFTCTVSRDGRHWAGPVRAASKRSVEGRRGDVSFNEYGDYESVVAAGGVAHAFWTDTRDLFSKEEEIYTVAIPLSALHPR